MAKTGLEGTCPSTGDLRAELWTVCGRAGQPWQCYARAKLAMTSAAHQLSSLNASCQADAKAKDTAKKAENRVFG